MLGSRISTVATPLLVLYLNKSPFLAGLVTFASMAPGVLIYLPAGVLVDRWNPRVVMLVSELLRGLAVASVAIGLAVFQRHVSVWLLMIAMIAEELLEVFSLLAEGRYVKRLTEPRKAAACQASVEVRTHFAALAGRPAGLFLFAIRPILPYLSDALSFFMSVGSLLLLKGVAEQPVEPPRSRPPGVFRDMGQGFRWLHRNRPARNSVILLAATSVVAQALIMVFLVETHARQLSTLGIGVVLAASGAGGAAGSFSSRFLLPWVRGYWLTIQMTAWSAALALLVIAGGQSAYWNTAVMFILGFTGAIGNVEVRTYLTREAEDSMIAKVTAIGQMLSTGASALGPVLAGFLIQHRQVQGTVFVLFVIMVLLALTALLCLFSPQLAQMRPLTCLCECCKDGPLARAIPARRWTPSSEAA